MSGVEQKPQSPVILIVDDNTANVKVMMDYLTECGFQIMVARTGETGMALARQDRPDLILLDLMLPGADGFEVCRRLKTDELTRKIPVIFMTILTSMEDKLKGFQAGGVDYITKPFQAEEVLARVRIHLQLRELTEHLEQKVAERTEALHGANAQLKRELAERKKAEEALRRLNLELDRRVLNRTAQLEASNKELEAFTYSVSHDLRAPLRHIQGFLELLEKRAGTAQDEQSRHYIDIIFKSAKKMNQLIDDLLSFSRMGRQEMAFQQVDLRTLVRDVILELEPDAADRSIDWRIGDLPAVQGDASMLRIVLGNLIANAVKFTRPRRQARIEIGSQPGQNADTVIYVRDNGVGFDMTYADKLFGVFQRLHRADEFEGTGIGLANVHRIIARHGGRAWAQGELGQGAAFFFSLPHTITKGEK
ncbi:MAG: response regulator [Desulfobacteraceae bacterium]|jgi:light-regulated signal transduction histidine kinase (bacteriophytochrome)